MSEKKKKRFFAKHAKSSAALISLAIHGILIVIALSFVAVTVITKEDKQFEAKEVKRPKMQLKKLQVPVKMEKKSKPKPKLRKRIVVKPRMNQNVPDIKMPEITGVKGGLGSAGDGLGGGGSLGFSMPEIDIFGVKGKGEKIFIILDSSNAMLVDQIGGIPAFDLIKVELMKMLDNLNPTVLFNIGVYGGGNKLFFENMVPASADNIAKAKEIIAPLNAVKKGMRDTDYGSRTIGRGAMDLRGDFDMPPVHDMKQWGWAKLALYASQQQADSIFLLSQSWGAIFRNVGSAEQVSPEFQAKWDSYRSQAQAKLTAENKRRKSKGQPPRVFDNAHVMTKHYFPAAQAPPIAKRYYYRAPEIYEAMMKTHKKSSASSGVPRSAGISKKSKPFAFNTIMFERTNGEPRYEKSHGGSIPNFKKMASLTRGDFRTLKGMEAIRSAASPESE